MARNIRKTKLNNKDISYLNRDFESLRNELIRYSKIHYGDKIFDFTEASLAGMFVDMAAYVGDVLSFYQDHQFNELSLETAVEENNIERLIRASGYKIAGPSPAYVQASCTIRIESIVNNKGNLVPNKALMPVVKIGTIISSTTGIDFELVEDINFAEVDAAGNLIANIEIASTNSNDEPIDFFITRKAFFTSSKTATETFSIGDDFIPFRTITLGNTDVSEIIRITDSGNDEYYEVDSLTQDTVFVRETNDLVDYLSVPERLRLIPAPKRYESFRSRTSGKTTIRFGSGNEDMFDEDVVPDPSEHAISLFGDRKSVKFASIDPNNFLGTRTLGISPKNTTLTIVYRYGGGVDHNAAAGQLTNLKTLVTKFQSSVPSSKVSRIRSSFFTNNENAASGGENEPTLEEQRQIALTSQNSQGRIVTKDDLLGRVYSMPNNFGRVFRAGIRDNPFNPFSSHLHVISRDSNEKLALSSDTLKENISNYLSKYRLITDAIDIVDALIINLGINYSITVDSTYNSLIVLQSVNTTLKAYFDIKNFHIDQPINISDVENIIINIPGVRSLINLDIVNLTGTVGANLYSNNSFTPQRYLDRKILYPIQGGIFEVKYPDDDISGMVE